MSHKDIMLNKKARYRRIYSEVLLIGRSRRVKSNQIVMAVKIVISYARGMRRGMKESSGVLEIVYISI